MSNAKRNYLKDFDYRRHQHTASASQMETFLTCPRKWWFLKVLRIPEITDQTKFVFGELLHEACERFLMADDNGRDIETGEPYVLWPKGWNEKLTPQDSGILKNIVEKGIEEGVLRRTPGRRVEAPFLYTVTGTGGRGSVGICGYRDVAAPGLVEDHKSSKSRKWLKSQAKLAKDPQMLIYAAIDIRERMEADPSHVLPDLDSLVTLRHNQFVKDPDDPYVRPCETEVSVRDVLTFWEGEIEPAATDMLRYKVAKIDPKDWDSVEGPRQKGACRKYGGCPFAEVCGGVSTVQALTAKVKRIQQLPVENTTPSTPGDTMGIFDRKNKKGKAEAKSQTAKTTETTTVSQETEWVDAEGGASISEIPPWAADDCKACEGSGFNSRGAPCAACDRSAAKAGRPRVQNFALGTDDSGALVVIRNSDSEVVCRRPVPEVATGDATRPAPKSEPKPAQEKAPKKTKIKPTTHLDMTPDEVFQAWLDAGYSRATAMKRKGDQRKAWADAGKELEGDRAPQAVNAGAVKVSPEPKDAEPGQRKGSAPEYSRGRPAKGFAMLYGAVRRTQWFVVDLNQLFHRYAEELAEAQGADSYYALDRFKRRDMLASKAKDIAAKIKPGSVVTIRANDPDIRHFASAIEQYATHILEGVN